MKKIVATCILVVFFLSNCQKREEFVVDSLKLNLQEGDLPSLHPHALMIYLRGISVAKTLFEGLARINAQGEAELTGAKSVEISPDKLRYTFTLRENKWSNGMPVTAHHYELAWKEALSPTSTCSRGDLLYMIKNASEAKEGKVPLDSIGVKALDDQTLIVELAYPSPYFLELTAQPICAPMMEPKNPKVTEFNGPFMVDAWKREDYLRLKPNPYYWDKDRIALKEIEISFIPDVMTAYYMYNKGSLDWIGLPLCGLTAELIGQLNKEQQLTTHPVDRVFWMHLNTENPALSSPAIRRALSLATKRSAITDFIFIGGRPLEKPLPLGLLAAAATSPLHEDIEEARKQFEIGLQEMGLSREAFPPLTITYSQQANRKQLAEYLQQVWSKALGIKVQTQALEWNVLRSNLEKGLYEISGSFEAAFYNDPLEIFEKYASLNPCNFSRWVNQSFKEKVALAKEEGDPERRKALLSEAEQILIDQMPFIPISSDVFQFAHQPNLRGYVFDYVGAIDFSRAYYKEEISAPVNAFGASSSTGY